MSLTKFTRDVQKIYEAIPTPGAIIYNATAAKILRKPERKIVNDIVKKMGSGTILDLGSGTGYLSIEIAKRAPGLQVYGIDLSRQMVKIAGRHAKGVEKEAAGKAGKEERVKGYKVKVKFQPVAEEEKKTKREAATQVIVQALRRLKRGKK